MDLGRQRRYMVELVGAVAGMQLIYIHAYIYIYKLYTCYIFRVINSHIIPCVREIFKDLHFLKNVISDWISVLQLDDDRQCIHWVPGHGIHWVPTLLALIGFFHGRDVFVLRSESPPKKRIFWGCKLLVDGSEIPNNHLGCIKPVVNNGINYQPQLVLAGFLPSTV